MLLLSICFSGSASAARETYALACSGKDNHVRISKNYTVSCSKKTGKVSVQGIGTKKDAASSGHAYPNDVELTMVVLECAKDVDPVNPALGSVITEIKCAKGKPKALWMQNVKPNPIPAKKKPTVSSYKPDGGGGDNLDKNGDPDACGGESCIDTAADPNAECNKENGCDLIAKYVNPAILLLSYSFGLIATLSIIMGGIQYAASAGDPQKVAAAKKRIINTVIAVVAYFFLYAFLQFLIPGGLFK